MKTITHKNPIFKHSQEDIECIYHYTNVQGAIGILSEKKIRMTNISCLNDWMEGKYFYDHLLELFAKKTDVYEKLVILYKKCFSNTYIASFSKKPEILSQYKYYGNICIAFYILEIHESKNKLNDFATSGFEVNSDIKYNPDEYIDTINKFANDNDLIEKVINEDMYSLLKFFCFFGTIKHSGFSEEKESRICHFWYDPKEVKYRFKDERRIPYIEFNFLPSTINKIVIGPHSHQDKIYSNFIEFIEPNKEYSHVKVCCSDIPFIP
jgi:hypothetical protein